MNFGQQILPLVLEASLVLALVAVGLQSQWSDLIYALKRPALVLRGVVAVNVLVPLAAVVLSSLFPLETVVKAGIILMAVAPLSPIAPAQMLKAGATSAFTTGLYVVLVLLSILIVPITLAILNAIYPVEVGFAPGAVARLVASSILAPLLVGVAIGTLFPALAHSAARPARLFSIVGLLVYLVPVTVMMWDAMVALLGDGALLVIALTVGVGLFAGRVLGGPAPHDRAALSAAAAIRHPGIAGAIAAANFANPSIAPVTLMFVITGVVMTAVYLAANKSRPPTKSQPLEQI